MSANHRKTAKALRPGVIKGWPRRLRLPSLVLTAALGLSGPPAAALAAQPPPAVFYQDFRGGRRPLAPMDLIGPDAATLTKPEDGGLRVTLPAGRQGKEAVGVVLAAHVTGDFEITAGYELVQVDRPKAGFGPGFEFYVMTATPTREAVGFSRIASPEEGDVYMCSRMTTQDGRRRYMHKFFDAAGKSGRLRLTRAGGEVTFWAAEGDADDFRELHRYDLGPDNVALVRLGANPGGAPEPVDLRIVDLRVRSETPIPVPEQAFDPASPSATQPKGWRRAWLGAAGIVGVLVAVSLLGVWLYVRHGRRARKAPATVPVQDEPAKQEAPPPPLSFVCPGCRKKLKVRAELAGKKVKCPQCARAVPVPGAREGAV
jgi:Protein of unknown function (DUF1583)